ncbi:MAG: transcription termination factor Rho [Actinomycetota bacterium]|nr:transcription termination factor Rho [Actinomycetota bacterium]
MSDSVLERSVLERKERDELQTIARAMGIEPASRARKAELVDMILSTAGIGGAGNGGEPPPVPVEGRRRSRPSPPATVANGAVSEPPRGGDDSDNGAGAAGTPAPPDQPAAEAAAGGDGGARTGESTERDRDRGDRDGGADRGGDDHGDGDAHRSGGDGQTERRSDGGDGDGNRRRRRRGRDRSPGDQRQDEGFSGEPVPCSGLLDLRDEGYGFLRTKGYLPSRDDVYVSVKQVRQFGLRKGDHVVGASRPASRNEKNPALVRVDQVNGKDPEESRRRPRFEDLTPLFPDERLRLETPRDPGNMTARIVDLVAPIGKGQRGMIVSPPKAGKTTIMKQIVRSIEANNPDVHLMVLLVDERPEEVTDMRRSTSGEVIASTFDRPSEEHTQVAELGIERAKRLVEEGRDVVVILDGITRLARAYNLAAPATGRIMSGGIDTGALYPPKKFFGAARNIEEGGSLTILATALIETGSKMDEVIFEEFKGTGNMELRLDRRLAERRIYPAIDVDASSTRHEELLFDRKQLQQVWRVRRALNALSADGASPSAGLERLMEGMKTFASNDEFLAEAAKAGGPAA